MSIPRYIVVEGVIGVGKTTLVTALSRRLEARTVFEVFEENPFLRGFYQDRARYAFSTEMFFLLSRFGQQETFAQGDLLQQYAVSDYLFEKCRLFAGLTLSDHELGLFERVYDVLARQVPQPDCIIHLTAPVDLLMERIAARGRDYERSITAEYLTDLDARYRATLHAHRAPVVQIDTTAIDFRDPVMVERLLAMLDDGRRGPFNSASFAAIGDRPRDGMLPGLG